MKPTTQKTVKPLILEFTSAESQATYFFNREFNQIEFIAEDFYEGYNNILYPSDDVVKKEAELNGYDDFNSYMDDFSVNHFPMWGYVWECDEFYINSEFCDVDKLYKLGIGVLTMNDKYYLFISGAGYDFYEVHWIPLFEMLGWIKYEN